ncbi:MAG: hypothetical protein AUJ92_00245 [Armatimonadetes bacterium CG2_30_59_28]|nr:MAG: hypothetical protein AUJ92_00245 [Armatimonadetes bacterium CG2_30_59_28]PIU66529.1 MAG: hypothetical protein COS85_04445 [Armatimonadetes bacterium CG07_land_8_20_14_0_80_59_28]
MNRRHLAQHTLAALVVCVFAAASDAAEDSSHWLNVKDFGASGSQFSTTATTTAGSSEISVKEVGDFKVGQGVMVSKCNPHFLKDKVWGPGLQYTAGSGKPFKDIVDVRGYDESAGSWAVYILDVERTDPPNFRWSDDTGRTWKPKVPFTYDWQSLKGGLEVRFHQFDWRAGYTASFSARDQLVSTIEKIEGNVLTLARPAAKSATDAVVRHCDQEAIQAVVNRAIKEKRNIYFPAGHYRLTTGVRIDDATGIVLEGASGENTVLDISEGEGVCCNMRNGTEITVRNFKMIGNMGFAERDQCGSIRVWGSSYLWGQDLKTSFATGVVGTERVTVEDVHAYRMSLEAFWSGGPSRWGKTEPKNYTKAITYLRCWAIDCGRNGFNNNDLAENTSILYCRIVDVGGCAWEGASRFVKFVGNYIRNAGTVAIGNISSRDAATEILPSGQHIVSDNVFESVVPYGGCAIRTASGATPVVISNNLFVNFGSSAIELCGHVGPGLPAYNATVTGNIFDMTEIGETSKTRHAIDVGESDVIVSNNQIYVRGACDPRVTAIRIREPSLNVNIHDNLIRNCGWGIITTRAQSRVAQMVDKTTFELAAGGVPIERRRSHLYRGWNLVWTSAGKPIGVSVIDSFDPETKQVKLKEPRDMKGGDTFEVYPPYGENWGIHDNTITSCLNPVVFDSYGSETSLLKDNTLTRGDTTGVSKAVVIGGRIHLINNHFSGFDEAGSSVLSLFPDRFGKPLRNLVCDNVFENCSNVVGENEKGLWQPCAAERNQFINCVTAPK